MAVEMEMGIASPVIKQYLELAVAGELSAFQAEMGKHPLYINAGRDVYEGRSPLHMAALHGRLEIVELIMASPEISSHVLNARDRFGYTPLHLAVRSQHVHVVKTLLTSPLTRFPAALSEQDEQDEIGRDCDGFTPLHVAAEVGNIKIVKLLLLQPEQERLAVNIHAMTWQGTTALDIAKQKNHEKLVDILERRDVNWLQLERQNSANSVNAILLGAALVSTVTFECLLQPPGLPPSPSSADYFGRSSFLFNVACSFSPAIVSLVIGTSSSIRSSRYASLESEVSRLRQSVLRASQFLFVAIFFLILAALQSMYAPLIEGQYFKTEIILWLVTIGILVIPIIPLGFTSRHIVLQPKANKWLKVSYCILVLVIGTVVCYFAVVFIIEHQHKWRTRSVSTLKHV